jgi:acyl-CoA reductase-like NAD-dependent aldehyde dehydrogenase
MSTSSTRHGSPHFPTVSGSIAPSTQQDMDEAVQALQAHKDHWVAVPVRERIAILEQLLSNFAAIAPRWVEASLKAKGLAADEPAASEEWGAGVLPVINNLRQLRQSLLDIERYGHPRIPGPVLTMPNGQVAARVFPQSVYDRLFFMGLTAEIWMEPGVSISELPRTQALIYQDRQHNGKVALVLGAGNVASIGPMDILYKLFVEDQVVLFKANPVNAYLGPLLSEAFRPLIDRGFLRLVYGGAEEGAYLCQHPGVEEIHITGSDKTYEAIVFGPGPEGARRKAARQPLINKRVTGELGNVSPFIVVPGPWTARDLAYQAAHIVSSLTNNAGFNCNATRVLIQHAGWEQRPELLNAIRRVLQTVPPRLAYYPGASERQRAFVTEHPEAELYGQGSDGRLPWTLITGLDPEREGDICYTTEAFCGLFAETALAAESIAEYIDRAVAFANERLWGTLNATLIVHPESLKIPAIAHAVERAVANLRYGTIGVNYWAGIGFALAATTWGAFPGHDSYDIQSGIGVVHNTLMFSRAQKSVLRGPFRSTPTPLWFVTEGRKALKTFPKLIEFLAAPSPTKLPAIMLAATVG